MEVGEVGDKQGKASPQSLGSLSALPLTSYVTLGESLQFSGPQIPICKMYLTFSGMVGRWGR